MMAGLSGMALYVPRSRVRLKSFCRWYGHSWSEVEGRVGESFRVHGDHESVYTMAANAVLRLVERYQINPQQVGCLVLATETSAEPAPGTLLVKSMVDAALERLGLPPLSSACEVPELKRAGLSGLDAMKTGLRFVDKAGPDRVAIVVTADITTERGVPKEVTQGAGAVAMLIESEPRILTVDLAHAGRAAALNVPEGRATLDEGGPMTLDPPAAVFGAVRTICGAVSSLIERRPQTTDRYLEEVAAIVMQRPYDHLPVQALSVIALHRMAATEAGQRRLRDLTTPSGASFDRLMAELRDLPDAERTVLGEGSAADPHPEISKILKPFRASPGFRQLVDEKMFLGRGLVRQLGNLGAAALPAWLGAALEEARVRQVRLADQPMLAVGFGLGDAAEALPLRVVRSWREAAGRLDFERTLAEATDLDQAGYEAAEDGVSDLRPAAEFVVDRVRSGRGALDAGVESYRYVA